MLFNILCLIHILLCLLIILLVLIQHGKGADAGAIMGSGAEAMLGAGNAGNVISKITTTAAIAFMVTSILLARFYQSAAPASVEVQALKNSVVAEDVSNTEEPARLEIPIKPEELADKKEETSEAAKADDAEVTTDKAEATADEVKEEAAETTTEEVAEVKDEAKDGATETAAEVKEEAAAVEQATEVKEETAVASDVKEEVTNEVAAEQENVQNDTKEAAEKVAE